MPSSQINTEKRPTIDQVLSPFRVFVKDEASAGILLFVATVIALVLANSPWADAYERLWQTHFALTLGETTLTEPLLLWVNDGLMAMFFFVVGLEIKREMLVGELSSPKGAALPIAAALGGMLVPAVVYWLINGGTPAAQGWGIPMATDIAFALGVLVLLGDRVPAALKIFLTALAIVDDLGAVLVIAFFYTSNVSWVNLAISAVFLVLLIAANWAGIRHPLVYGILGIGGLWLAFLLSGVHPTIAGVLAAMAIPARTRLNPAEFIRHGRQTIQTFEQAGDMGDNVLINPDRHDALLDLRGVYEHATTPLQRLESALHPWVSMLVLPLFALANAGVPIEGELTSLLTNRITVGVVLGLVLGKQIGITLFAWLAVRLGVADLPQGVAWRHIYGVSWLGGIGFTMSLFIGALAFTDPNTLSTAKLGILLASAVAAVGGALILRRSAAAAQPGETSQENL